MAARPGHWTFGVRCWAFSVFFPLRSIPRPNQLVAVHLVDTDEIAVFAHRAHMEGSADAHRLGPDRFDALPGGLDAHPLGDFRHGAVTAHRLVLHDQKLGHHTV